MRELFPQKIFVVDILLRSKYVTVILKSYPTDHSEKLDLHSNSIGLPLKVTVRFYLFYVNDFSKTVIILCQNTVYLHIIYPFLNRGFLIGCNLSKSSHM